MHDIGALTGRGPTNSNRRRLLALGAAVSLVGAAKAQGQAALVRRVGVLALDSRPAGPGGATLPMLRASLRAYGPDLADISTRTAAHIDRVLRGAKPAEIPVEEPRKFQLVVNLKTARAIGYAPPPAMLARADLVIE
jgi:hypothetical protein